MLYVVLGSGATKYMLCSLEWVEMQRWSGGMQWKISTLPEFNPWTVQPVLQTLSQETYADSLDLSEFLTRCH